MLSASVTVEREVVSSIGKGVLVFAAVAPGDTEKDADSLAAKVLKMKLWDDDAGGRVRIYIYVCMCMCMFVCVLCMHAYLPWYTWQRLCGVDVEHPDTRRRERKGR